MYNKTEIYSVLAKIIDQANGALIDGFPQQLESINLRTIVLIYYFNKSSRNSRSFCCGGCWNWPETCLGISSFTHGSYDTATGSVSESITSTTIKGILQNVNQREINDLIKENDKILIIAASDLEQTPTTSDRVLIASIEYLSLIHISEPTRPERIWFDGVMV